MSARLCALCGEDFIPEGSLLVTAHATIWDGRQIELCHGDEPPTCYERWQRGERP